jgi:AcrR family transcriptional regulator
MSSAYELTGRTRQKARTRAAMVSAARDLLAEGVNPTVEQASERAGVSRSTAYRYFPNQRALILASYPELGAPSLLGADGPADPAARLDVVTEMFAAQLIEHEPELRAMLRMSLEVPPPEKGTLPLRRGRAIGWLTDALSPLRDRMPESQLRRLVLAIRATLGIEALVWLTDVAGLSRQDAVELMRSSAHTLLEAALESANQRP